MTESKRGEQPYSAFRSVSAGIATAAFNRRMPRDMDGLPHFDSRIRIGANESVVVDYFRWR
jgi:tRNA(His) 5'-end guanylyltransferase